MTMQQQSERQKQCQLCLEPLTESYIDGATVVGPWAIMCDGCHKEFGVGWGIGRASRHDVKTGKKLVGERRKAGVR
jgi:hypothetical protein